MTKRPRTTMSRYGLAVAALVIAALVRVLLDPFLGDNQPLMTFVIAVAVVATTEGLGPAIVVLVGTYLIFPLIFRHPRHSFALPSQKGVMSLVSFTLIAAVVALMCEALRSARKRAEQGQEDLRSEMARRAHAESELVDREERWRKLIENNTDVVAIFDVDGTVRYASGSISGKPVEDVVGTKGFAEVHPDDFDRVRKIFGEVATQPESRVQTHARIKHVDGSWRTVEAVIVNHLNEPSIRALVVTTRDVTEQFLMQDKIAESEGRFRSFMDHSPALSYLKSEDGRYVWGNHAWARQFDRRIEHLIGLSDNDLWPEEIAQAFRESDRRTLETGLCIEVEEDAGDHHFFSVKFPLEHGGKRYVGGKTFDITDRVLDREARQQSEKLLLALADSMPQIVWAARPDGQLMYLNKRWYEFTGFPERESIDQVSWLSIFHPDDVARCQQLWQESIHTGEPFQMEFRCFDRRTGGYRWFLGRSLPVRDAFGQIERWYGTSTDIDDQKCAEKVAEAANHAKDRFLAVLSHELRTPLTPILLSVSTLLNDSSLDIEMRASMEMIRRNVALEARLIDDLLDLTRIIRGTFTLQAEPSDTHALITRALEICRGDFESAQLSTTLDLAASSHIVQADPARLQQVFWNLFKNAVKFSPRGSELTVRSWNDPVTGHLVVEVEDRGIGIDPAFLPRMFEAFEQGEASPWARKYGGLGLGLAISRSIIEAHKGRLKARSEGPGRGATFQVELPLVPTDKSATTNPSDVPGPERVRDPLRILLIEDDPSTLSVLARLLRHDRHNVTTATSVSTAMSAAEDAGNAFDLIISDIGLPDGTGIDLLRALHERTECPAIALTGFGMDEDIRKGEAAGFHAHLTKPIDFRTLEATIRKVIGV